MVGSPDQRRFEAARRTPKPAPQKRPRPVRERASHTVEQAPPPDPLTYVKDAHTLRILRSVEPAVLAEIKSKHAKNLATARKGRGGEPKAPQEFRSTPDSMRGSDNEHVRAHGSNDAARVRRDQFIERETALFRLRQECYKREKKAWEKATPIRRRAVGAARTVLLATGTMAGGTVGTEVAISSVDARQQFIENTTVRYESHQEKLPYLARDATKSPFAAILNRKQEMSIPNLVLGSAADIEENIVLTRDSIIVPGIDQPVRWAAFRAQKNQELGLYDPTVEAAYQQAVAENAIAVENGEVFRTSVSKLAARDLGLGIEGGTVVDRVAGTFNWEAYYADRLSGETHADNIELVKRASRYISPLLPQAIFATEVGRGKSPEEAVAAVNHILRNLGERGLALFPGYGIAREGTSHLPIGALGWGEPAEQLVRTMTDPRYLNVAPIIIGDPEKIDPKDHKQAYASIGSAELETDAGQARVKQGNEPELAVLEAMGGLFVATVRNHNTRAAIETLIDSMDDRPNIQRAEHSRRLFNEFLLAFHHDQTRALQALEDWYAAGAHRTDSIAHRVRIGNEEAGRFSRDGFANLSAIELNYAEPIMASVAAHKAWVAEAADDLVVQAVGNDPSAWVHSSAPIFSRSMTWQEPEKLFNPISLHEMTLEEKVRNAVEAEGFYKIDAALNLAILQQESSDGMNFGQYRLLNDTGDLVIYENGKVIKYVRNGMHAEDVEYLFRIADELNINPYEIPMSGPIPGKGHSKGGCIGYGMFRPSTWWALRDQIQEGLRAGGHAEILSPFNARASMYGTSAFLANAGATRGTREAENAATQKYVGFRDRGYVHAINKSRIYMRNLITKVTTGKS